MPSAVSPLGPQALSPHSSQALSPHGAHPCLGEILLGKGMDSPLRQTLGFLRGSAWQENSGSHRTTRAGASKKGRRARKTPIVRGTDCPRPSLLSSPSFALAGPRGLMCQGQGPLGALAAGLSGPWFWRARNKQASKPRTWLAEEGRSFTSVPSPYRHI